MNNVLELKGKRFEQANRDATGGGASMNSKVIVTTEKIFALSMKLAEIINFWHQETKPFNGVLISVFYNKIVAKSNRISGLFKGQNSNYAIVGAKFNDDKTKHIITYFLDIKDLENSVKLLNKASSIIKTYFPNGISKQMFDEINKEKHHKIPFEKLTISKSTFKQVIADISYIDNFGVEMAKQQPNKSIVTLYDTNTDTIKLCKELGIDVLHSKILDNQTVNLDETQMKILFEKAPYLVSMATEDMLGLFPDDFTEEQRTSPMIMKSPTIEPVIGVIDTLFDKRVYFGEWVEYHDMIDDNIPKTTYDYQHGTAVDSIIVDGPRLNPWLDDGCGNFRVRHFGVAKKSKFSSFTIMKQIREIIEKNKDIKVWNLSLGSNQEINDNFISMEGAVLDKLQSENDVIFVIAGTNKTSSEIVKIGSPADSINSVVVNAVTKKGLSTKYSRRGLALSFFAKPDVSYYGGSEEQYIRVCEPLGAANVSGTSYAAPWIARKLSYLIDVLGMNKEVAKAMLIDSARGWNENPTPEQVALYGHGIVPIRIEDIVYTKDDEIKFLVTDISEKWNTYNYEFPIPLKDGKYPFIARATMCYFPKCDRAQGVDYTNTELNLHFGRINDKKKIVDIKGDEQNQDVDLGDKKSYILEGEARKRFRKWDNVKYVSETPKSRLIPKKAYTINKNWGMEIKTNNRLNPNDGIGIRFGVVVTIKEMNGVNRIDEFIRNCHFNGWLVNKIDIQSRIEINEKVNEEIELD